MSRPTVVAVCMIAPPNRGSLISPRFHGTHVPAGGAVHSINSGLLERSKTVCERPSPEKPMHNAQGRPGKCCGGGGYLPTGNPPPKKIDEAVFVEYRLSTGC